jgi:Guanylate kinase
MITHALQCGLGRQHGVPACAADCDMASLLCAGPAESAAGAPQAESRAADLIDVGGAPANAPAPGGSAPSAGGADATAGMLDPRVAGTEHNTTTETTDEKHSAAPLVERADMARPPVVLMGPSGVGKGTLVKRLMSQHGDKLAFTVSHTTRAPRAGEADGVAYVFVDKPVMQAAINAGSFLEHAEVHGHLYGTSVAAVERCAAEGKSALLEIDVQARPWTLPASTPAWLLHCRARFMHRCALLPVAPACAPRSCCPIMLTAH